MARSFGSTDNIQIGFTTPVGHALSWSGWLLPNGTNVAIARDASGSGSNGIYLSAASGGFFQLFANGTFSSNSTFGPTTGVWCQLGFSCTTNSNGLNFFANGAAAGSDASHQISSGATNWWIGNDIANRPAGTQADFAFWNVILTAAEWAALGQGARPYQIRETALIGWWPLDGIQSPEPDLSGSAANGTLTGTAKAFGPPLMQFTPRWPQPPPVTTPVPVYDVAGWSEVEWG